MCMLDVVRYCKCMFLNYLVEDDVRVNFSFCIFLIKSWGYVFFYF